MANPKDLVAAVHNFDVYNLNEKQIKLLQDSKNDPDLEPGNIKRQACAAEPFANWIKSLQEVADLKSDLKQIDASQKRARYNKAKSAFPDGVRESTEHMGVPLRKIDSEGNFGEDG